MLSNKSYIIILGVSAICFLHYAVASSRKSILGIVSNSIMTEKGINKNSALRHLPWPKTGNKNILVTGGVGYIGSHTILTLLEKGYDVTIVDNLVNSNIESIERVKQLTGCDSERIRFYNVDLCDYDALEFVFKDSKKFDSCIHFAGLKAVGESVSKPLFYYENNIGGTLNLLKLMDKYDCTSIVFSSSATVYGSAEVPITEDTQTGIGITNAYGRTKYFIEEILKVIIFYLNIYVTLIY